MDTTEFFGTDAPAPDPQGYDRYGRYLLDADGTGQKPYTRSTTLAKTLDDGRGIAIWEKRKAAKGVAMSPALTARAAVAPLDDKAAWREILNQAEVKSGGDEKRDLGSAFHEFHQHVGEMSDEQYAAVPAELRATYQKYRAELARLGIEEVLTEFTCVNTQIGTAGKGDAIFRLADGRLVIGDRKTGRVTEYPHSPAVQFAVYANSDVLITFGPNGEQLRQPMPKVDKTIALVVDITIGDESTAAVHVYEVDIWAGWYGALLAGQVRRWRNRKDLVRPYHPELPPVQWTGGMITEVRPGSVTVQQPDGTPATISTSIPVTHLPENQAWFEQQTPGQPQPVEPADRPDANTANTEQLGGPMTQPPHAAHPITKQAWSSAEQRNITLNPDGSRADGLTGPQVSAIVQPVSDDDTALNQDLAAEGRGPLQPAADIDALLARFKTKAQLQAVLAKVAGPGANLARQRKNLAADAVAHPNWPQRRAEFLPAAGPSVPGVGTVVAQTDVQGEEIVLSPVVSNAPGPVPPDPEPQYAGEDGYAGGEPYPAAVDAGTNPFRPGPGTLPIPVKTPEDTFAERISVAATLEEIATIWDEAQKAGIGWPPRLHQASTIRTKQINEQR